MVLVFGSARLGRAKMATTSKAIRELLTRKGVTPTGDKEKDMVLAKSVMPAPYKRE